MTRKEANDILDRAKEDKLTPLYLIDLALKVTGDLNECTRNNFNG
jgi:hypothetical protein